MIVDNYHLLSVMCYVIDLNEGWLLVPLLGNVDFLLPCELLYFVMVLEELKTGNTNCSRNKN